MLMDTQDTATNLIELLPLEANIPPRSSVLGNISFDVKASNYTRESFENIKIFYKQKQYGPYPLKISTGKQ